MPNNNELEYNIPGKIEVPSQTKDSNFPEDLKRINNLYENLFNRVYIAEQPKLEESNKSEKLKKYISEIHNLTNNCFNESVNVIHTMANTNYSDYLKETENEKKKNLLDSLNYLRNLMEIINSLITKDGKLNFKPLKSNSGEILNNGIYAEWNLTENSYFPVKIMIQDYPKIVNELGDSGENTIYHRPRIMIKVYQIAEGKAVVTNLRFDLDPSSSDKFNPYERIVKVDINYPNQDLTKQYDYKNSFTYHFPVATNIDYQQFHYMCLTFKNQLKITEQR